MYFGGIDGGASNSTAVILNEHGKVVVQVQGPDIPLWLLPIEESAQRVSNLMQKALNAAKLPSTTTLKSLGLCLSGASDESNNEVFVRTFSSMFPSLCQSCTLKNDTYGPVKTACTDGGMVLISGTGSNCQYIYSDITASSARGWGHLIGDEGSAYWIAIQGIKRTFDHLDNFNTSQYTCDVMLQNIFKYFKLNNRSSIMDRLYTNFNKSHVAGFCKVMSELAHLQYDELSLAIFKDAGKYLGQYVIAISQSITADLGNEITVICVGSVWKSWDLLKIGFVEQLQRHNFDKIKVINFVSLTVPSAIGAALIGAHQINHLQFIDTSENSKLLFRHIA